MTQNQQPVASGQSGLSQVYIQEHVFTADECATIRAIGERDRESGKMKESRTQSGDVVGEFVDYRKAHVTFTMPNEDNKWVFQRLYDILMPVNNAGYRFDLHGFEEGAQISEYPVGNGYVWHADIGWQQASRRKLSMTVQLSQPGDYEGGDLEFMTPEMAAPRSIGALCVFPSFMLHRVSPVTSGVRWSLVSWVCGTPFR